MGERPALGLKGTARAAWRLLSEAWSGWNHDNAPRLGAALAYYTLFSIAPLLIIAIALAGLVFGQDAQGHIVTEMRGLLGDAGARALEDMVEHGRKSGERPPGDSARRVHPVPGSEWRLCRAAGSAQRGVGRRGEPEARGLKGLMRERLASFAMVLVVGFLLLVSLLANAALATSVASWPTTSRNSARWPMSRASRPPLR